MARTRITGDLIRDGSVTRADLNVTDTGSAVIAKVVAGTGISLSSTGPDAGTGDVTITATGGATTATQTTTNSTPTTILTLSPASNSVTTFRVLLSARFNNTGTNKSYWAHIVGGCRRNNAGSLALVGVPMIQENDEGSPGYTVSLTPSGNNLLIQVTGATGETVNWTARIESVESN